MNRYGRDMNVSGDFFGAIIAGLLLGLLGDGLLGTSPGLTVAGIVAGSVTGFYAMYRHAKRATD